MHFHPKTLPVIENVQDQALQIVYYAFDVECPRIPGRIPYKLYSSFPQERKKKLDS